LAGILLSENCLEKRKGQMDISKEVKVSYERYC